MKYSMPVENFRLAYDRAGAGPPVVLLHGWPGDHTDFRDAVPLLAGSADVVVPDLRGFGESDKLAVPPEQAYSGAGQARSIIGLIEELGLGAVVLAGYDVGSFVAQSVAAARPDLVRALVVSPPLPGAGKRVLTVDATREFWYPHFHALDVSLELIDGKPAAVRSYLRYFWSHWAGPSYRVSDAHLDHLVDVYGAPGAFAASIGFYRSSSSPVRAHITETAPSASDRLKVPTTVLWQELDPLFPESWSDRLSEFFTDYRLERLVGVGHYTPLEAPEAFAAAIERRLAPKAVSQAPLRG
jgi:pimeloyl-ACP methyl ester carboxylesterase